MSKENGFTPKVKGSKQEDLILVPHRPVQKALTQLFLLTAYCAIAVASFYVGQWVALRDQTNAQTERDQLRALVAEQEQNLVQLREELVFFQQGNRVEKRASELLRQENKDLQDRVAELEEENAHYHRVLTPEKEDKGLVIGRLELKPTSELNRFRYNFNMIQVAGRQKVTGEAFVTVMGIGNGEKQEITLEEISVNAEGSKIRLGFRNFQAIAGEIKLPQGFVPEQVEIIAQFTGRKAVRLRKVYDWKVQETNFDVGQR